MKTRQKIKTDQESVADRLKRAKIRRMSKTKSIAAKLDEEIFDEFQRAVSHYYIGTGANFVDMACKALVATYRRGEEPSMPLRLVSRPPDPALQPDVNTKRKTGR